MIIERHMKQAKRIDNGEIVIGYLTIMWGELHIINPQDENTAFPIDPDTVEDVAVKPAPGCKCPNCRKLFYGNEKYCCRCGQRIDWNIESER